MKSGLVAALRLLFFVLSYKGTYAFFNVYPQLKEYPLTDGEDPGAPLFLTPLIENGEIEEARTKALVQHKDMGNLTSYSGYFTVNETYNSNLFFWFFPAMHNPETAPVVIWLQGGPGATSLLGLFFENGPFTITANKTLEMRKYSWNLEHNVIYIDNPIGVGYSFTDDEKGYATNEVQVGSNLHNALVQFFLLFPELQNNDFFVTGESYAGKYVPAVSYAIKNYNIEAKTKINLKGLAIGNGWIDPENQIQYDDYLYQIGLIDENGKVEYQKYERECRKFIKLKKFAEANEILSILIYGDSKFNWSLPNSLFYNLTGFEYYYNYLKVKDDTNSNWMSEWIQRVDVRSAIHVGNNSFHFEADIVQDYLIDDVMQSVVHQLEDLVKHYKVLLYNGQLDILVPYSLTKNYIQKMKWSGTYKCAKTPRKLWKVGNELAGYVKSVDNLTEVLVRNAGHMVPYDQPKWALDLITRFTHNKNF